MRPLKSLTFESVIGALSATFLKMCDRRDPAKVKYALHDVLMSGFAMMFFHHPSLLQFQERMKQKRDRCNLETLFEVTSVPSDTQMREILDEVSPEGVRRLLPKLFEQVRRAGWAEQYKTSLPSGKDQGRYYTMPLDGMEYFHSNEIECPGCLKKEDSKSGQTSFSHSVVGATLVKAGSHRIFPLDVEEVRNTDGRRKQDCELNAGKRLVERVRKEHPQLSLIVLGDDLYSHEPFVESLIEKRLHFVLVAKPESHQELREWVEDLDRQGDCVKGVWEEGVGGKRRLFEYRMVKMVPLKAGGKVGVNYVEVWERDEHGKLRYHNSWVTDLEVDADNVAVIVRIGRSRWKIESAPQAHRKEVQHELTNCASAAREMKGGPSESAFRSRLQTTPSRCGQEPLVVSVGGEVSRLYLEQVRIRETNESEPSMTRRKPQTCRQNQGRFYLLGRACRRPDYWVGGDRRIGGVKLIQAPVRNCGNQSFRCEGRSTSGRSHEASVPKRSTGTDRPVRAMKASNAAGAKGSGQAVVFGVQLETGGNG